VKSIMKSLHRGIYAERLRRLVDLLLDVVRPNDRILDVGCGNGTLLDALVRDPRCPKSVSPMGVERVARGGEPIPVIAYDGGRLPFDDASFDVVTVADVLHHEPDEEALLRECLRVARRVVVVKDHAREGPLAQSRISLMDWAANAPYGVPCLYRYHSLQEWRALCARVHAPILKLISPMRLYPRGWELLFGGRLQIVAVLDAAAARAR